MKTRIITAIVLFFIALPALVFSDTVAFPIAILLCCLCGVFEMLRCIGYGKSKSVLIPSEIFALLVTGGTMLFNFGVLQAGRDLTLYIAFAFSASFFYLFYMFATGLVFRGGRHFPDVAVAILTVLYIVLSFTSVLLLRRQEHGEYLYLLVFIGPFVTDVFAYFTGVFFGKHKLIKEISPKKTIEGSIGGTIFGTLSFLLFGFVVSLITQHFDALPDLVPNYFILACNGLIVSVFSQIGDLTTSWIKREHGIKDYGRIFPGHGGVMDRFDSVLMTAPLLLIFSTFTGTFAMFTFG